MVSEGVIEIRATYTKDHVYDRDISVVKKYGRYYRLTNHKTLRKKGWEEVFLEEIRPPNKQNEEKLENNIVRARSKIFELGMCNKWDWMINATLDEKKYDRSDLEKYHKDLSRWIRNQRAKYNQEIKFLLVPELHKDGVNWHIHGLIRGLDPALLSNFIPGLHPQKLIDGGYLNWPDYAEKFGFISLKATNDDYMSISKYITKYVTKNLENSIKELGKHLYYASQGLETAEIIAKGTLGQAPPKWEFENEYIKMIWVSEEEINQYIPQNQVDMVSDPDD